MKRRHVSDLKMRSRALANCSASSRWDLIPYGVEDDIMEEGLQFTCPVCGFIVMTPMGEADLKIHVELRIGDAHSNMIADRIKGAIKTVSLAEAYCHRV